MKVTVKDLQSGETVYSRIRDDKTMNAVVSSLVSSPAGGRFETNIENKGHSLTYRNDDTLNIDDLVRRVEGVVIRKPAVTAPVAQ